jgi:hypothetical protein
LEEARFHIDGKTLSFNRKAPTLAAALVILLQHFAFPFRYLDGPHTIRSIRNAVTLRFSASGFSHLSGLFTTLRHLLTSPYLLLLPPLPPVACEAKGYPGIINQQHGTSPPLSTRGPCYQDVWAGPVASYVFVSFVAPFVFHKYRYYPYELPRRSRRSNKPSFNIAWEQQRVEAGERCSRINKKRQQEHQSFEAPGGLLNQREKKVPG